jgi:small GTP-binding protein
MNPQSEYRTASPSSFRKNEEPYTNPNFPFKVILLGSAGVGKTCFIQRVVNDTFEESYDTTIIGDLATISFSLEQEKIRLQLWDTCGLEQYRAGNKIYYRGTDIALIVYDVTKEKTFEACGRLIEDLKEYCSDATIYLIGNKCDLLDKEVSREMVKELVKKHGVNKAYEVSSK